MRFIEELRNKYKGREIWILGCGPSGDDFPLDFFDNKISIAIRPNDKIFPNCTYNFCGWGDYWKDALRFTPHPLPKQIFSLNPAHKPKPNILGKYINVPIFLRTLKWYSFGLPKGAPPEKYMRQSIKRIMNKNSHHYCGDGLIQGWAIEAALVLGAKKIALAGCDGTHTKNRHHAERLGFFYDNFIREKAPQMIPSKDGFSPKQLAVLERGDKAYTRGLILFAKILPSYDIEIQRYFYKTGYEKIDPFP